VRAGFTDRHTSAARLVEALGWPVTTVEAEQVHGGGVAVVERWGEDGSVVPGCDALLTRVPGLALAVRSADCLPMFFADPPRGVIGIAHAGWRGLAASLPVRVVSALRHTYHSQASELRVALGPAIRMCCYEVGAEFAARFGSFVRDRGGRRTCDLVGVARAQLVSCGIRPDHVLDSERCTACDTQRWFSLRREGPETGRLTSVIALRPSSGGVPRFR
jgi:YfiH family protein